MSTANNRFYTIVDLEKYKTKLASNNILSTEIAGGVSDDPLIDITDAFNNSDTQKPVSDKVVNISQEELNVVGLRGYAYLNRDGTTGVVQNTILKDGLNLTGRDIDFVGSGANVYKYTYPRTTRDYRAHQATITNYYTPNDQYQTTDPGGVGSGSTDYPPNGASSSISHGDDIDAGKASTTTHRDPIRSNNVTGFRINYNTQTKGQDIGDLITPSHSYNQGVSGTDNNNQKKRQIWMKTGSLYGHLRGAQGGGAGAAGARSQGQEQRSGGAGGNAGKNWHAGFIYPESDNTQRLTEISFTAGAGGAGGWGGKAGGSGQDGFPGGGSQQTILTFKAEQDQQGLSLTIHGTGGGTCGEGGEKGDKTSDGQNGHDVQGYPTATTTHGYTWVLPTKYHPIACGGGAPTDNRGRNKFEAGGWAGQPGITGTFRSYVLMGSRNLHLKQGD